MADYKYKLPSDVFTNIDRSELEHAGFIRKISTPVWNRLEARPRGQDIKRSLCAEVRDALWMLTRQWQLGEFAAEDAGTPVYSDLQYKCSPIGKENETPIEVTIESQPIFPDGMKDYQNLGVRVEMGNYFLNLLSLDNNLNSLSPVTKKDIKEHFINSYKYSLESFTRENASIYVSQYYELYKGRSFDGYKFYKDNDRFISFPAGTKILLEGLFVRFKKWYVKSYFQPENNKDNFWTESQLAYNYKLNAAVATVDPNNSQIKELAIREYYHGHLDWYNFALQGVKAEPGEVKIKKREGDAKKIIPTPLGFAGMPESRYWAFEDGGTNFASINPGKNDLAKLAIMEFGLIYSNDWSVVPLKVPIGTFVNVTSLVVIDSFGKETLIESISKNENASSWDKWSFFSLDKVKISTNEAPDNSLFFPPTVSKALHGKPLEEIFFIRDEMANIVWAIETIVPSPVGFGISGRENANEEIKRDKGEKLRYTEQTAIPKNWIPFIPVFLKEENKTVLRRGVIKKVRPVSGLLRPGITKDDTWERNYDIDESEITREGVKVTKAFQHARWVNGEVFIWVGNHKETGKGEGLSWLAFDQLKNE